MIRAIFFDLDGTLLSPTTGFCSPATKAALFALKKKGIKLCVATGRSPYEFTLSPIIEGLPFDAIVALNGLCCYDKEGIIYQRLFDKEDLALLIEKVKAVTKGKGVNACVEVTGISAAMNQALECASWMGRISLLGCTRLSDSMVDYYQQVHRPGVKLIGAHNFVRPKFESYPHHWTHHDDCRAILDMISSKRLQVMPIISRVCKPDEAPRVYKELAENNAAFPIGTVFDWREM